MRTEHIILALTIAREKSITKAAEALFISQPNASNMLKVLEKETGYPIFDRTSNGIIPTEKGEVFLGHAATIERSLSAMAQITDPIKQINLRILSFRFVFAELAFEKICKKYISEDYTCKLSIRNTDSTEESRKAIESGDVDISIAVCRKGLYDSMLRHAINTHIEIEILDERHLEVICKKGHPIIATGKIDYSIFSKYQAFTGLHTALSDLYAPYFFARNDIALHNLITIGPSPVRYRLLTETNGYLLNTPIPEAVKEEYGLASLIVPDSDLIIFAAYHRDAPGIDLIKEYTGYCKESIGH